ncbi:polysaccharide biosynthesis/export family protein [Flavobacterium hydatis]|jgi:polysaccharide export outer membrane protein|uniref:Ligand-binding protein n=1 Tax=Flavobacterium hydatis TaxID=991 RepID=A0A085ZDK5_FLAHY|nr:polysaccharide biosynthesis/export family protein [Flavobacterium hydatis]KFF02519.1 ligand-binding protein [Flavobacterium hydatis]OXA86333.1 ligand-binding protein [Flavobacterium hydatis]
MNKYIYALASFLLLLQSCASKKEILYFQDSTTYQSSPIEYTGSLIQPNDILSITVGAKVPETVIPYNIQPLGANSMSNIETIKLQGYLVSPQGAIIFPVLGSISVANKTTSALEQELKNTLEAGGHLIDPTVSIRLLNAKVTVLGEVNKPGTYSFTEQYLTLPQALGYAGDLTINGKRKDIILIRESEGVRTIKHLDLTTTDWMNNPDYTIRQNDVLVINPNNSKVKSSGYIGNAATILTIASLVLSTVILLTR